MYDWVGAQSPDKKTILDYCCHRSQAFLHALEEHLWFNSQLSAKAKDHPWWEDHPYDLAGHGGGFFHVTFQLDTQLNSVDNK